MGVGRSGSGEEWGVRSERVRSGSGVEWGVRSGSGR